METEMRIQKPRAMLVNVGGAITPALHALNEQQPDYICFFVSPDSKPHIREKILPALVYQPEHYDWIETPVPQDLLTCFRALSEKLPPILEKWGVRAEELAVEYTAGTKPMSVAVVLATIEKSSQYFYIGSRDSSGRDRNGIGVVLDGKESTWFQTNPWEELAIPARKEIALLFNHGRYTDAQERTLRLAMVVPAELKRVFESLAELIEGYALWDRFEYKQAQAKIYKSSNALQLYIAGRDEPLRSTLDQVGMTLEFLRGMNEKGENAHRLDVMDMLANAGRRADIAQKYDDATARLYSTLESLSRYRLDDKFKINASKVRVKDVPQTLQEEYQRKYGDPEKPEDGLKLGLQAQYYLLAELGDGVGTKYKLAEKELNQTLQARNLSRLAHGTNPVSQETYRKMREIIMDFADIQENDLPRFPTMKL